MSVYLELLEREERLHKKAAKSKDSKRRQPEKPSPVRTEFQRDRDRILHSKSFRRLKHKTQVFISPGGDHFRTRLTHTLEVSQIARTIARALNLNEELAEAIALGHDLGHTPFGHMGEKVLSELSENGFKHYEQSLRVVEKLEYDGAGLNLTNRVKEGIVKHSKGLGEIIPGTGKELPSTLEGQIVRISDIIAYVNHDLDDSIRAGILTNLSIPESVKKNLGTDFSGRIDTIVTDIIHKTVENDLEFITISQDIYNELILLREFLYEKVYLRKESEGERNKIRHILILLFEHIRKDPFKYINLYPEKDSADRRIIDFIAGMTDNFALNLFRSFVLPKDIY